jgi:hypothetical protein
VFSPEAPIHARIEALEQFNYHGTVWPETGVAS